MKQISLFIPLLGTLLLSGCAGTNTEFECNATTSDTCMTMEQANEKAKKLEQSSEAKPVVEVDDENEVAWLEISLPLVDPITLVEDENGPIPRGGKRYQLEKPEIWVAQAHQLHCQVMP